MSIATITRTAYANPTSLSTFLTMLDTAMGVAGFTLYDTDTISGAENKVYSIVLSGAAQGTVYLKFRINNTTFSANSALCTAWNTTTNASTNEATGNSATIFSFTSAPDINFIAISSDELKGVLIVQNDVSFLLGVIRPANWESWYDEAIWTRALNADNYMGTLNVRVYGTLLNPGSINTTWLTNAMVIFFSNNGQQSNPYTNYNPFNSNKRQVKPIEFIHPGLYGITATTSNDLVVCCSYGIAGTGTDELVTSTGTYLYIGKSATALAGMAVRIA